MIRGDALTHVAFGLTAFLLLAVVHSQVNIYTYCSLFMFIRCGLFQTMTFLFLMG